jgi:transmembrane sensor
MNKFENYQVEDFIQDVFFRKWVLGKLSKENHFWENWLNKFPEKRTLVEEAKSLVVASQIVDIEIPKQMVDQGIQNILMNTMSPKYMIRKISWLKMAAIFFLVMSISIFVGNRINFWKKDLSKNLHSKPTETQNNGNQPLVLQLSDGSTVTLKKGSNLMIASDFGLQNRTVYLTGEAFFEVKKDSKHPFLVYAGGIVTKVLGTSFNIRAYKSESKTLVAVRTGRVTVYQQKRTGTSNESHPEQMLITPNQQIVFEKKIEKLLKTLVPRPVLLYNNPSIEKINYDEIPISKVLIELEQAYGVKIVFDNDLLAKCNLTAVFNESQSLYDKIGILCETIHARYEIVDGQIVIYAAGCR